MRAAIARLDPAQPLNTMRPMSELVGDTFARQRFATQLFAVFSLVALLLAAIGLYGVLSYTVSRRTTEIGVRMALGARTRDVVGLVLARAGTLVGLGLGVGLLGTLLLTRSLQSLLYQVTPQDPATLTTTLLLLVVVALAACVLPALRAAKLQPMAALRAEGR